MPNIIVNSHLIMGDPEASEETAIYSGLIASGDARILIETDVEFIPMRDFSLTDNSMLVNHGIIRERDEERDELDEESAPLYGRDNSIFLNFGDIDITVFMNDQSRYAQEDGGVPYVIYGHDEATFTYLGGEGACALEM